MTYREKAWRLVRQVAEQNLPLVDGWRLTMSPYTWEEVVMGVMGSHLDVTGEPGAERFASVRVGFDRSLAPGELRLRLEMTLDD